MSTLTKTGHGRSQNLEAAMIKGKHVVTQIVKTRFLFRNPSNREIGKKDEDDDDDSALDEPIENLHEKLREMWSESCDNLPVYKDVPRLIRRVKVHGISSSHVLYDASAENLPTGSVPTARLIVQLLKVIAEKLENDETVDLINKEADEALEKVTENTELQFFMKDLVHAIGPQTKTVKVLKCLHQNVVLQGVLKLKQTVTKEFMTKDMKTDDGWQILIVLADYIQIKHLRREQSIDPFGDVKNHWELDWEIAVTFDKNMSELTQSQVRITKLTLSEDMDKDIEEKLKTTLMDGNLIVV